MTPEKDEHFDKKVADINQLYLQTPKLTKQGIRVESTDEMTGVQALERKHAELPMASGKVERCEFEYERHGVLSFIFNFNVATGRLSACTAQPTRAEQDYANHIRKRVEAEPNVNQWHFVNDNLNTHMSETLARYVAAESDLDIDLGRKGKCGILKSKATRAHS